MTTETEAVEEFLSSLWTEDRSTARRAYAAHFISAHRDALDKYIDDKITVHGASLSTVRWARKTRKLIQRYETGPKGYAYNPRTGALESAHALRMQSFRMSRHHSTSLTLPSHRPAVRMAGYFFALVALAIILWAGYTLSVFVVDYAEGWADLIRTGL